MPAYRSRTSTHGRNMAGARGLWRATGMQEDDFGTPIMWSIKQERPTTHYIWRTRRDCSFTETFYNTYGMTGVVLSIGDTVIGGEFSGNVEEQHGVLSVEGSFDFYLRDEFADPADIEALR